MFCASRNVIGRLAWADADIAIAADAPMTAYARQRGARRELGTVGMEEVDSPGGSEQDQNVGEERRRVETRVASTITLA
jgi:hypothetical protein